MLSRREVLAMAGSTGAWLASAPASTAALASPGMGGAPTAFFQRIQAARKGGPAFDIVEHCHRLGLAGVQTNPPATDPQAIAEFRKRIEAYNLHLVCDPRLPKDATEVDAFESKVKAYKEAGASAFHAAMTGRRYEDFDSPEPFKAMFERSKKSVELAEPVLRKYKVRLGIENHKGWRSPEQAAWMKQVGSEWVGVCFDFGNNLSLCEDPLDTLRTLAPYIFFTHIKDMAVEEYEDGFLLAEVPMGEGMLDIKQMVQTLREKDPTMIFELETITRDPLKIPVFTKKYWATFDDAYSPLPGRDLAATLSLVHKNHPKSPLPRISALSPVDQIKAEDEMNAKSIAYAKQNLGL